MLTPTPTPTPKPTSTPVVVTVTNRVSTPNTGDGFNMMTHLTSALAALGVAFYSVLKLKKHS